MKPEFVHPLGWVRTTDDRIIVSAGIGGTYRKADESTRWHCTRHCPDAWQLFYDDYPDGCPKQEERQYAFKIYALREAIAAGFRHILWLDSAFQPIASIEPLWREIREAGWYVPPQYAFMLGEWCSDEALAVLRIDRETAWTIPLVFSGLVGFDLQHPLGAALWRGWEDTYERGAFDGNHFAHEKQERWGQKFAGPVSDDPRVRGHRHDESALSWVLWSLGLTPVSKGFLTLESPEGFIGHLVPCP